ncbi:MAG: HEAT repeat domain-containing protein [Deltaproteobacteria bacterium]|nr:HEAT repeat domain-containing protein [Deltaproteobacteria bacterium]
MGLITAQVLATIQVYVSNLDLYSTIETLASAGYLTVPNERIAAGLNTFGPAFWGGLFFTLSIGAGLSLITFIYAHVWNYPFKRNKALLIPGALVWAAGLAAINRSGLNLLPSSYFLLIPPLVFISTLWRLPREPAAGRWIVKMIGVLPLVLLATLWLFEFNSQIFLKVRDHLLLTNPVGEKINSFYYRYTLYPAEAFKSPGQKTLKTSDLSGIQDEAVRRRLEQTLSRYDYLPVPGNAARVLKVETENSRLIFKNNDRTILEVSEKSFQADPGKFLGQFSAQTDKQVFFRRAVFYSLLLGLPITLYVIFLSLLRLVAGLFLSEVSGAAAAAILCLAAGLALWVPITRADVAVPEARDVPQALTSEHWPERTAALRLITEKKLDIHNFPVYKRMLTSPHVPERYQLAKALSVSRHPETYKDLLSLLGDSSFNVVYMAYHGLGLRRDRRAVAVILSKIKTIDNWYVQNYAYYALKNLGWTQRRSK